jgi:signal transduction histidine kinase
MRFADQEVKAGRWRWAWIVGGIFAVSVCHYLTPPAYAHWHVFYQRLYYLPILFAAFWYGLRGGLIGAAATSVLYLPHVLFQWGHEPLYRSNQLAEILMFFVIGTVAGWLIDRIRSERERHRNTAEELARAYAQLRGTFDRLRLLDRLSSLGALSAGMAHEIKTPLGSILGSIEILETAVPETDERREFVGILKKEIRRLSEIVSRHLDLVRPDTSARRPHDVGGIAASVVDLARREAERRGVRLELERDDELPAATVDGSQVRQAILNLVVNAIEAVDRGGFVRVLVREAEGRVVVAVEDDGPGIDPETVARVFEPFYTTKPRGTGLGLSIAFQIAALHGGDLRAEARSGGGTRFTLELPLATDGPTSVHAPGRGA